MVDTSEKWNDKYSKKVSVGHIPMPNKKLSGLKPVLKGGKALDLACGLGGNSFYLAENGYAVTGLDISEVAVNFVNKEAGRRSMQVKAYSADLSNQLKNTDDQYDLVIMTYFLARSLFPTIKQLVNTNGYFFMETYFKAGPGSKETISDAYKLESNELLEVFRDWRIIFFEEAEEEGRQTILCQKK
ncbi:class I SAM-dependent methyltransferase [Mesobacillus subterraneus]|uniref:Methyltransferase domain-containing protein n=1 Tax=Mesobacillus subterraneus TaxID=285983 RepID=A0A3R9DS66_9BACI|nr:methyltransferase domain-containing protein [Mesobacillus subterraneus]RSD26081.1 methyltransferase domain-containing protein [Mesobacillus subterraneus]